MTNFDSDTAARRGASSELRPDARLIALHSERGQGAHSRLESALAALEGAEWGVTLAGEAALAQQLRALLGAGVLRVDPRLPLRRDLLAEAGLAAAGLDGDWRGAVAAWLLEPGEEDLRRAERAGVPVIVDATLAPGAHWLAAGAQYVTYHHGAALTGFAATELTLLFGAGERPAPAAPATPDLTAALALRDVATLPLRLARAAQTAASLESQLAGRALPLGPTALLLPPEAAPATAAPLGGVLPATRPVQGGVILTPGLADARQVRALLRGDEEPAAAVGRGPEQRRPQPQQRPDGQPPRTEQRPEQPTERPAASGQEAAEQRAAEREPAQKNPALSNPAQSNPSLSNPAPSGKERQDRPARQGHDGPNQGNHSQGNHRFQRTERFQGEQAQGHQRPAQVEHRGPSLERFVFETPARPLTPAPQPDGAEVPPFPVTAQATADATPLGHEPQADRGEGSAVQAPESAPAPESTQDSAASPQPRERGANRSEHRNDDRGRRDQRGRPGRGRERGPAEHAAEPLELEPAAALQPDLPVPAAQPGSGKPDPTADLTDEQSAVFARLRDWRNAEASRQEISRFIVASNATLAEIARRVPYTVEDLQTIKGMGPARLSKYGEAIVQVVRGTRS